MPRGELHELDQSTLLMLLLSVFCASHVSDITQKGSDFCIQVLELNIIRENSFYRGSKSALSGVRPCILALFGSHLCLFECSVSLNLSSYGENAFYRCRDNGKYQRINGQVCIVPEAARINVSIDQALTTSGARATTDGRCALSVKKPDSG